GDVARIPFAIDLGRAVENVDVRELRQRDALSGGSQQPYALDRFFRIAVVGEIAKNEVVALFAVEYLRESIATDRRLDGILNIGNIDAVARGALAIDRKVQVGLPNHAEDAKIFHAADGFHHADNLITLGFERFQVVAIDLDGQRAFDAADRFFQVVRDGLREVPEYAGNFFQFAIHRGDEPFFVLVKDWPPLFFRL